MKIIEKIIAALVFSFIFYIAYFGAFIAPQLQSEMKISREDLKVLSEYKSKYPEFVGLLCNNALSDNIITRKEFWEIVKKAKDYEESLLYKKLVE